MVVCISTCWVLWFCCNCAALSVPSRGVVVRAFRNALDHCVAPQNPGEAISRDGSSDRCVGCPELREEWKMHHADVLSIFHLSPGGLRNPHTSAHIPGTVPGPHNGVEPGGIGKAQSAKASSITLIVLTLVSRRHAAPSAPRTFVSSFAFPEVFALHGYDCIHSVAKSCTTTAYR